jgi:hypothetical protein
MNFKKVGTLMITSCDCYVEQFTFYGVTHYLAKRSSGFSSAFFKVAKFIIAPSSWVFAIRRRFIWVVPFPKVEEKSYNQRWWCWSEWLLQYHHHHHHHGRPKFNISLWMVQVWFIVCFFLLKNVPTQTYNTYRKCTLWVILFSPRSYTRLCALGGVGS